MFRPTPEVSTAITLTPPLMPICSLQLPQVGPDPLTSLSRLTGAGAFDHQDLPLFLANIPWSRGTLAVTYRRAEWAPIGHRSAATGLQRRPGH